MRREGSIGLIAPDALVHALAAVLTTAGLGFALLGAQPSAETEFEQRLDLVPATLAKGLDSTTSCSRSPPRSSPPNPTESSDYGASTYA